MWHMTRDSGSSLKHSPGAAPPEAKLLLQTRPINDPRAVGHVAHIVDHSSSDGQGGCLRLTAAHLGLSQKGLHDRGKGGAAVGGVGLQARTARGPLTVPSSASTLSALRAAYWAVQPLLQMRTSLETWHLHECPSDPPWHGPPWRPCCPWSPIWISAHSCPLCHPPSQEQPGRAD